MDRIEISRAITYLTVIILASVGLLAAMIMVVGSCTVNIIAIGI